jgi:uncharacterized protein YggE
MTQYTTTIFTNLRRHIKVPRGHIFQILCATLVLTIIVMLAIWQPWYANVRATDRTISITGTSTITTTPDQFVFSPSYTFANTDKQVALAELSAKSVGLVMKLKSLGVASKDIKTNADSSYGYGYYAPVYDGRDAYTMNLTVTTHDIALTQKVQDYLVTTSPTGAVTPNASFSSTEQKALKQQARDSAENDARTQANQSAKNLGFKVDAVESVIDSGLGSGIPIMYDNKAGSIAEPTIQSAIPVQPGQNDLSYSVQIVYYIH